MHHIPNEHRVNINCWADNIESAAIEQINNLATLGQLIDGVAIMPDVHAGKGCVVGSVINSKSIVIPAAIGSDIGCGIIAKNLGFKVDQLTNDQLINIRDNIISSIPLGNRGRSMLSQHFELIVDQISQSIIDACGQRHNQLIDDCSTIEWRNRIATLGGGNHFIELCYDDDRWVWVLIHSGSRSLGRIVGDYFARLAKQTIEEQSIKLVDDNLSYFDSNSQHCEDYLRVCDHVIQFAEFNRRLMIDIIDNIVNDVVRPINVDSSKFKTVSCMHNYVERVRSDGTTFYVHRKGSTEAKQDQLVLIPGSMGTATYVAVGLGNRDSFNSCSHGAGRVVSRKNARASYTLDDLTNAMSGIVHNSTIKTIDEIPYAYKDITHVIALQSDLIKPVNTLRQLLNLKG